MTNETKLSGEERGCLVLVVSPVSWLADAWVAVHLWRWFVVPFGAPPLTMPWAFGLLVLAAFACKSPHAAIRDGDSLTMMAREFAWSLIALVCGFIAHWLMT